jgi:hypothetical protein
VIASLPKSKGADHTGGLLTITLLNTDYKVLAHIIANRLRPMMAELLQSSQFYEVPGNTIFEAVATVREAIAHAELTRKPLRVLSLDFREHSTESPNLLKGYGFSDWFIDRIKCMSENAISSVQSNGHIAWPIPIQCSIRQCCLMSRTLFVLCIDPLIRILEQKLSGIRIGKRARRIVVVAYTGDVTIFVTITMDPPVIQETIACYERTGIRLNTKKSKALTIKVQTRAL